MGCIPVPNPVIVVIPGAPSDEQPPIRSQPHGVGAVELEAARDRTPPALLYLCRLQWLRHNDEEMDRHEGALQEPQFGGVGVGCENHRRCFHLTGPTLQFYSLLLMDPLDRSPFVHHHPKALHHGLEPTHEPAWMQQRPMRQQQSGRIEWSLDPSGQLCALPQVYGSAELVVRLRMLFQRACLGCVFCQEQSAALLQVAGKGLFLDGLDEELIPSLRVPGVGFNGCSSLPLEALVPAVVLLCDKAAISSAGAKSHRLAFDEYNVLF